MSVMFRGLNVDDVIVGSNGLIWLIAGDKNGEFETVGYYNIDTKEVVVL